MNSSLNRIKIASPCPITWQQMTGDDRVRFCSHCQLNVYNLSALSKDEAEALLVATEGRLCARFFRRADGTVITKDCPVGVRALRRKLAQTAAAVFALIGSLMSVAVGQSRRSEATSCITETRITQRDAAANVQETTLTGQVLDPNQAVIIDAVIILQNVNTKATQQTRSDEEGRFRFSGLAEGKYQVKIESPGFKKYRRKLEIKTNQVTNLDVTMRVKDQVELVGIVALPPNDPPGTTTISEKVLRSLPH